MRARSGARARAMVDVARWCRNPACRQLPAHTGPCQPGPADAVHEHPRMDIETPTTEESSRP